MIVALADVLAPHSRTTTFTIAPFQRIEWQTIDIPGSFPDETQ